MRDSRLTTTHREVLRAIARRGVWCSTHSLGQLLPQYTGETAAKKARDLRHWRYLDWRKVPDRKAGGVFVEYRIPSGGAKGRQFDPKTDQPILGDSTPPCSGETVAADEADLLFKLPPPDRHFTERTGRATR